MAIVFGTEGWRAVLADEFTVENVRRVTQAIAEHFASQTPPASVRRPRELVVGYDTRFLSEFMAQRVAEILAGNGFRAILSDRAVPTCTVSRAVVDQHRRGGIMVTASHNPAIYNGLKVKEAFGGSATPKTVASIEQRIPGARPKGLPFSQALDAGRIIRANLLPGFLRGIRSFVDLGAVKRSRLAVVVDSMHGTGGRLIEQLLAGGRCRVETLRADPDPLFGGHAPEPIPAHLGALRRAVKRRGVSLGIANDGDADRIGVLAPTGAFLNPGQVLCVLLHHLVSVRNLRGTVVKTVSNTSMIDRLAHTLGLALIEVPVGFKHIAKFMLEDRVLIGGEESGGIGIHGYLPERDGILIGVLLLEAMAVRRQGILALLRDLERQTGRWAYARRDLTLDPHRVDRLFARLRREPPRKLVSVPVADVKLLDGIKLIGRDDSWLLFRRSGTEPIVRIYAETPAPSRLNRLLGFGVNLAKAS